ncbi:MAG: MarR family winged helix-turn-helix transcriptional regulator [Acidimicrobiia bacterium]
MTTTGSRTSHERDGGPGALADADERGAAILAAVRELRRTMQSGRLRASTYGGIVDLRQIDMVDALAGGDRQRISDLAVRLRVDASTATRAAQQLEGRGLVRREVAPDDGRAVLVSLTEDGRSLHAAVVGHWIELARRLMAGFEEGEQVVLLDGLRRLVAAIDAVADEADQ